MKISPKNILSHVIIGLEAEVLKSTNPQLVGLNGTIIDETQHLILLATSSGVKKIIKKEITLLITLPDGVRVVVEGVKLIGRPEDRVKRVQRRRW